MQVFLEHITDEPEDLIERACRTCYLSWHRYDPPNSAGELIKKVIKKGHHSVLEHASATFRVQGASRVFTHEMVRHRLASFSQESQRYVCYADRPGRTKTKDYEYVTPPAIDDCLARDGQLARDYDFYVGRCFAFYEHMLEHGIPPEDARYILPNATVSEIVISANLREWRHICELRCHPRAHWEIREVMMEILNMLKRYAPNVFFDFVIEDDGKSARRINDSCS